MLTILDKYILKRYLATFLVMLLLFIPIGITVDIAEKINKILENKVPIDKVLSYYVDFIIYFTNFLFPIFLFLSIIWFTAKLANNTEIIAILSSGISFSRFLRPYIIGATIVSFFALLMGFFLAPKASEGFKNFRYLYLIGNGKDEMRETNDVYRQISETEFIYVSNFDIEAKTAYNFVFEKFNAEKLVYKISASSIQWNSKEKTYTLLNYSKRTVGALNDKIETENSKPMKFNFDLEDLTPVVYIAETLSFTDLNKFIKKEKKRGSANINTYLVVKYRKYSIPISAFILTIIAVAVSSMKRRGGMGINLAIGIAIAFSYIFLDKIFATLAEKSSIEPIIAIWIPNFIFGILAFYLLRNAKR
ncbi:putative lipopolysaccharide export system permease protein, lptF/lptG family [Flavobacterium psychrophilum]|uniref:LptF/LptG family permease n=1 Tax=Flavobacterium psychrophilum TaxID=96345 RepID=UPI000B7C3DB4|nr:LptF/LptG family permease [Flavobacterium psychrophilum]SNB27860.1 putative lipopolysaccharide export system permease protein, lptF/lptG family [Flavobacterium psychrophilum]